MKKQTSELLSKSDFNHNYEPLNSPKRLNVSARMYYLLASVNHTLT